MQIDFGDNRDLSGLKTQGLHGEYSWVEAFQIGYSNDGHRWNIIKDKDTQSDRIFIGNYNSDLVVTQYFDKMINARYLRITPVKWHTSIGMRLEIIGCYQPYIQLTTVRTKTPASRHPYLVEQPPVVAIGMFCSIIVYIIHVI